jgi:hypothetical protein
VSEFRDAIARTADEFGQSWSGEGDPNEGFADAVLAMPEMRAIRKALVEHCSMYHHHDPRLLLLALGLPESVIAWVLEDQP